MILDFYALLKQFVMDYPNGEKHERINTFAVLDNYQDLNSPNLTYSAKDGHKSTFFSRSWNSRGNVASDLTFEYPLLAIREDDVNEKITYSKGKTFIQKSYRLEMLLLDTLRSDCEDCTAYAKNRSVTEIYEDTLTMFNSVLTFIGELGYQEGKLTRNPFFLEDSNDRTLTKDFIDGLSKELRVQRFFGTSAKGYGNLTDNMTIRFNTCEQIISQPRTQEILNDRPC
jgi:hypothetical protein